MKRLLSALVVVAAMTFCVSPGFAMLRKDLLSVKGSVSYINSGRTEITVKDIMTGKDVTFKAAVPGNIMVGNTVVVLYKKGTMDATLVRLIPPKKAVAAVSTPAAASVPAKSTVKSETSAVEKPSKYSW